MKLKSLGMFPLEGICIREGKIKTYEIINSIERIEWEHLVSVSHIVRGVECSMQSEGAKFKTDRGKTVSHAQGLAIYSH